MEEGQAECLPSRMTLATCARSQGTNPLVPLIKIPCPLTSAPAPTLEPAERLSGMFQQGGWINLQIRQDYYDLSSILGSNVDL